MCLYIKGFSLCYLFHVTGRQFYKCPKREENDKCNFFLWADESSNNTSSYQDRPPPSHSKLNLHYCTLILHLKYIVCIDTYGMLWLVILLNLQYINTVYVDIYVFHFIWHITARVKFIFYWRYPLVILHSKICDCAWEKVPFGGKNFGTKLSSN